jgi:hypothetical protein
MMASICRTGKSILDRQERDGSFMGLGENYISWIGKFKALYILHKLLAFAPIDLVQFFEMAGTG